MPELIIKRHLHMARKGHQITPNIKIHRENNYINRHKKNEDWIKSGVKAAGWMGKHALWDKPTLQACVADINKQLKSLHGEIK